MEKGPGEFDIFPGLFYTKGTLLCAGGKEMSLLFLGIVFLVIVLLLTLRQPLYQAILGGLLAAVILYRIPLSVVAESVGSLFTDWDSFSVVFSIYLITYLQRMLEARQQIRLAQQDLNGLFHNRRINASGAPLFIGLLPSAAAMILCGDIVKESTEGYLNPKEQAFVTNWFRHIPESTLPTYSTVILMSGLSGVPLAEFIPGMIIPVVTLWLLAWFPFIHRLPKDTGTPPSDKQGLDALHLLQHLWTLMAIIALIMIFNLKAAVAILLVIAVAAPLYRFHPKDLFCMIRTAFEPKLIGNTALILILKEFIAYGGAMEELPSLLSGLPIPAYLIFSLMFFLGGMISGSTGIIAVGAPLAFAALGSSMPLVVLFMCVAHAASLVSPTHLCLVVASDYFGVSLGSLIRKTLPRALLFALLMIGYYNLLIFIL
ncbi:MAG: DUF401 family protein [Ruminococcaceae bacterium]|nr:DUF401 family protein [Oscillospiraceae bacterium]